MKILLLVCGFILFTSLHVKPRRVILEEFPQNNGQLGWDVAIVKGVAAGSEVNRDVRVDGDLYRNAGTVYIMQKNRDQWFQTQAITAPEPQTNASFGSSISMFENFMVIGASMENSHQEDGGRKEGAAYIFKREKGNYKLKYRVALQNPLRDSRFGQKVAIAEQYMAVACMYHGDESYPQKHRGAVLVYKFSKKGDPKLIATLMTKIGEDDFGQSMALEGNILTVSEGNRQVNIYKIEEGKVSLMQKIKPEVDCVKGFADDLAINRTWLIIGVPGEIDYDFYKANVPENVDSIFIRRILDETTFTLREEFIYNDRDMLDSLGISKKDFREKAKPYETWSEYARRKGGAGKVLIYRNVNGRFVFYQTLEASDAEADDHFGHRVAVSTNRILVGAFGRSYKLASDYENRYAGAAYSFKYDDQQWNENAKLKLDNPNGWDKFGFSVACDEEDMIIGCRLKDLEHGEGLIENAGAVYINKNP